MPKDKTASHVRVMAAAREEFMAYGFEKASMRRVGEKCGLTAAGLYRHCRDKEDLFNQLVAPALERLNAWMDTHLTKYLATYWAQNGVRCNAICPAGVENGQDPAFVTKLVNLVPMGRMAHKDEYQGTVLYMISDASAYMTGSTELINLIRGR